jgi:hypothetical protein
MSIDRLQRLQPNDWEVGDANVGRSKGWHWCPCKVRNVRVMKEGKDGTWLREALGVLIEISKAAGAKREYYTQREICLNRKSALENEWFIYYGIW